jgi:general secretion pathway protein H
MGKKAERELQVTLPAGHADAGEEGFTLLEIVCVLAIVAMLAAIVLPAIPRGTTLPRVEAYALQTAALLNADHTAAQRQNREIATLVDAPDRTIRSGASSVVLQFPSDVVMETLLAQQCNARDAGATIRYLPSGMSCGGVVSLTRQGAGFQVRVNWLTGGAEVVPIH